MCSRWLSRAHWNEEKKVDLRRRSAITTGSSAYANKKLCAYEGDTASIIAVARNANDVKKQQGSSFVCWLFTCYYSPRSKVSQTKTAVNKKSVPTGEPLLTVLAKVEKRAIRAPVFPHHRQRRATRREEERKTKKNGLLHFVQKRRLSLAFRFTCDSRRKIFQTKCWVS